MLAGVAAGVTADLVGRACGALADALLALDDIAAAESDALYALLQGFLEALDAWLPDVLPTHSGCRGVARLRELVPALQQKLLVIVQRFLGGDMPHVSAREAERLVLALFAEGPLRTQQLALVRAAGKEP